ncbi:MAG: choice-of-anchor B family protein [Thermoanaerobaculia bacterium]
MSKRTVWSVVVVYLAATAAVAVPPGAEITPPDPETLASMEALGSTPCVGGQAGPYPCANVNLLAFMPLSAMNCGSTNDIWGWTDPLTDTEYALVGCNNGTAFVDISDPTNPLYLGKLPTHTTSSLWRDIKVYEDHAFVVSEASGHGLQVFDLTNLRDVPAPPVTFSETAHLGGFGQAHNVAINEDSGFAYVVGAGRNNPDTCFAGLFMVNIQSPANPEFAGCFSADGYTHDVQCVIYHGPDSAHFGKEICVASNEDTVTVVDVTDKSDPMQLARKTYPGSGYTHQGWLTEDHRFFLLDDELDELNQGHNTRTRVWDATDLDNPVIIGTYDAPVESTDHNQYTKDGYVYQSNYSSGLRILDLADVADGTLTEAGFFDVYPSHNFSGFDGSWSNYPYFDSGVVILTGIDEGLFVVQPNLEEKVPKLTVSDASVDEGDTAPVEIAFPVSISSAADGPVTVDYETADGTAVAGVDYVAASGTLEIPAGEIVGSIAVQILPNDEVQEDRSFSLILSNPEGATIAVGTATGTILDDDDPLPVLTVDDPFVQEGDEGPVDLGFTVSLSFAAPDEVSFHYATFDGTGVAGEDYTAVSGTGNIDAGATQAVIDVPVLPNFIPQEDRTVFLVIDSPVGATVDDPSGEGTILDDDAIEHEDMDPSSGAAAGGEILTQTGQNFVEGVHVEFGTTPATEVEILSETVLEATTPPLAAGELFEVHVFYGEHEEATPAAPQLHPQHLRFLADFLDVPRGNLFQPAIEILRRQELTGGCGGGLFCVNEATTRGQMAPLLLRSFFGGSYEPPACVEGAELFADVPFDNIFCPWIEDLASRGITAGCGGGNYCPNSTVDRQQMAVFLLKTLEGPGYTPPACSEVFDDVPCPSLFADWVEDLASRGITAGCGGGNYCPAAGVLRGQMATFLVKTFAIPFEW